MGLAGLAVSALGQTNLDANILHAENVHDLSPVGGFLRLGLWFLAGMLLIVAAVLTFLRYGVATKVYETTSDTQWKDEAQEEAGERAEASEIIGACEVLDKTAQPAEAAEPAAEADQTQQARLFTPASGAAWREPMLKAFRAELKREPRPGDEVMAIKIVAIEVKQ